MQKFYNQGPQFKNPAFISIGSVSPQVTRNWDIENDMVWWGQGWQKILGYTENSPYSISSWRNNIHPTDLDRVTKTLDDALSAQIREFECSYRFMQADGSYVRVYDTILLAYKNLTPVFLTGIMQIATPIETKILAEKNSITSLALEASGSGSFTLILDTDEIIYSPNFSKILTGQADHPVSRQIFIEHIHPDDLPIRQKAYELAEKSGVLTYEARFLWKDGSIHWIKILAKYVGDETGRPVSVTGIAMDISEKVEMNKALELSEILAEKTLRESEALFRNIADASTAALWMTDPNGAVTYVSQTWIEWTGAPAEMHLGNGWLDFVAPQDLREVREKTRQDFNNRIYHQKQFCIVHLDSTVRCVVCKGKPQYNSLNEFTGYIGAVVDVTDLVETQKELETNERLLNSIIRQSPVAIGLLETEALVIQKANPALLRILSKDESVIGQQLHKVLADIEGQKLIEKFKEVYQSGCVYNSYDTEVIILGSSGPERRYFNIVCAPVRGAEDDINGVMLMASDFTSQHLAQLAVSASEQKFRNLIAESPVACALFSGRDLVIEYTNEPMIKIFGKGNSVQGKKLKDALPELEGQPYLELLDQVYQTGIAYQSTNSPSDLVVNGQLATYYFDFSYTPLFDENNQVYGILDMAVDVTERVKALKSLLESEKRYRELADDLERSVQARTHELNLTNRELLNSNQNLEQFAYAASHDLQEPLRKVVAFGSRLAANYEKQLGDEGAFLLSRMQDASRRMSRMIDDLLSFSRLTANQKSFTSVHLSGVIQSVLSDLEIIIVETKAVVDIDTPVSVWGEASQLSQLFLNLISNALKYQPPGQTPHIQIKSSSTDLTEISSLTTPLPDHSYVKVTVQDNGIGFDQKYVQRIFQMFQRLHGKNEYSGSGIGLALCNKVVQNHNGLLTAESQPGKGARFIIYLPLTNK